MMNSFSVAQGERLRQMFGEWVSFDLEERRIYSHDVAPIPKLIKPILGDTTATAVVQPATEEQLVELVHWANENKVHLVPRAKATSGYGGVLPVKGGVCVSMNRMRQILAVDKKTLTARVQPGVVWGKPSLSPNCRATFIPLPACKTCPLARRRLRVTTS